MSSPAGGARRIRSCSAAVNRLNMNCSPRTGSGSLRKTYTCNRCSADTKSSPQDDCRSAARCSAPAMPSEMVCKTHSLRHIALFQDHRHRRGALGYIKALKRRSQ